MTYQQIHGRQTSLRSSFLIERELLTARTQRPQRVPNGHNKRTPAAMSLWILQINGRSDVERIVRWRVYFRDISS